MSQLSLISDTVFITKHWSQTNPLLRSQWFYKTRQIISRIVRYPNKLVYGLCVQSLLLISRKIPIILFSCRKLILQTAYVQQIGRAYSPSASNQLVSAVWFINFKFAQNIVIINQTLEKNSITSKINSISLISVYLENQMWHFVP